MLTIDTLVAERFPIFSDRPGFISKKALQFLRYLCHESEFKQFEADYPHLEGFDFVEQALNHFNFGSRIMDHHRERIPVTGTVVVIANHPIGSLDGLALLKLVGSIRRDVKVVANELLYQLKPLRPLLLPVDNIGGQTGRANFQAIQTHLKQQGVLIIFPAGEVSRFGPTGIKDGLWNSGFLRFAERANAPILPLYLDGRNSIFFYALSLIAKPVSTLWLIREMFKQADNHVDIRVGPLIEPEEWRALGLQSNRLAKVLRRHVYQIGRKKRTSLFAEARQAVAHPENRQELKQEIKDCVKLGETADQKEIRLYRWRPNSSIMRELGRLRELTFRCVKEGTGLRRDVDGYDRDYDHILLWDDQALEIVGAYRVAPTARLLREGNGEPPLYTQTLFDFSADFIPYLCQSLELGRSFVQPRYWGKRSLDYLWYGIGAYLKANPEIRYLFGPVSISNAYSAAARDLLVNYYGQNYRDPKQLVTAKIPYLAGTVSAVADFNALKSALSGLGYQVPTLYKQYTEICEPAGVRFSDFALDADFGECIDGFIIVDTALLKPSRRERYMGKPLALCSGATEQLPSLSADMPITPSPANAAPPPGFGYR